MKLKNNQNKQKLNKNKQTIQTKQKTINLKLNHVRKNKKRKLGSEEGLFILVLTKKI